MKVLFASPDRDLLSGYRAVLEVMGHTVATAFDGAQIPDLIASDAPDVAVMDETLPRFAADGILCALRERHIPSILLSAREPDAVCGSGTFRPDAYLFFPFAPGELIATIGQAAENAGGERRTGDG